MVDVNGLRLPSPNEVRREHHMARHRRVRSERAAVGWALRLQLRTAPPLPALVRLTRIGPRLLDQDNAVGSMKAAQDEVARFLGCDDGDRSRVWFEFALRIEIRPLLSGAAFVARCHEILPPMTDERLAEIKRELGIEDDDEGGT